MVVGLIGGLYMRKELLKGLTEEQIKKVEACKSSEELLNLAKAEGIELTDEQLEAVSGGGCFGGTDKCPECGSEDITTSVKEYKEVVYGTGDSTVYTYKCRKCGHKWFYTKYNN
jgi:hypothetical protein